MNILDGFDILTILLCTFIIIAFYFDARYQIIPNKLNLIAALSALLTQWFGYDYVGLTNAILGMLGGFAMTFVLYWFKALAAGDVKFFAAIGTFVGFQKTFELLFLSILLAALIAICILIVKKSLKNKTMPFMYAVFPPSVYIIWGMA